MIEQVTDYVIDNVFRDLGGIWQHITIAMFLLTCQLPIFYLTVDSANQSENRATCGAPAQIKFEVTEHAFLDVDKMTPIFWLSARPVTKWQLMILVLAL